MLSPHSLISYIIFLYIIILFLNRDQPTAQGVLHNCKYMEIKMGVYCYIYAIADCEC